jgi:hypothetical protein
MSFLANSQQGAAANAVGSALLDGALAFSSQITPVGPSPLGYKPVSLVFTAATSTATLAISSPTLRANALLVDHFKVKELRPARWSAASWTGDEDSSNSSANTYTHACNLGATANVVINGVTFTGVGGDNPAVAGRFSYTAPSVLTGNAQNNLAGSSRNLGNAFVYGSQTPRLTLEGLTPGASHRLKLFGAGFGPNDGRRASTFMGGGSSLSVDENVLGQGNGIESRVLAAGAYHLRGIANQVLPVVLTITQSAPPRCESPGWRRSPVTTCGLQRKRTVATRTWAWLPLSRGMNGSCIRPWRAIGSIAWPGRIVPVRANAFRCHVPARSALQPRRDTRRAGRSRRGRRQGTVADRA